MKTVGVVLSGCGFLDGSEIHEAVLTLLALARRGIKAQCFAPDKTFNVVNHQTGDITGEQRNILVEAARIARGDILPLTQASGEKLDGLIMPGGFGVAKNLSDFASQGAQCQIEPALSLLANQLFVQKKPLGFICIAPVLAAKMLDLPVTVTIGNDQSAITQIEQMGGKHQICSVNDIIIDSHNRLVSTPAYMLATSIEQVAEGIDKLVDWLSLQIH